MHPLLLFWIGLTAVAGLGPAPPSDPFDALHARGQALQRETQSIAASFTETTVSSLLVEPLVSQGTLVTEAPGRMVMDYLTPERRRLIVDNDRLAVTWPDRDQTEMRAIGDTRARVQRFFANASPDELRDFFDIAVDTDPQLPDTVAVTMTPRRGQIREGLALLELWVEPETAVMRQMRMTYPTGDSTTIALHDIRLNDPIDEAVFTMLEDLPDR